MTSAPMGPRPESDPAAVESTSCLAREETDPRNKQAPCQKIAKTRRSPECGGFHSPSTGCRHRWSEEPLSAIETDANS